MNSLRFEHAAMATEFVLIIKNEEKAYAQNAAQQIFQLIDDLEAKLSRFRPDSDIARINKMKAKDQLALDRETWEVMQMAIAISGMTEGSFDIGVARHMDIFRATKEGILSEYEMTKALEMVQTQKEHAQLFLDPENPMMYCVEPGIQFDLGGIGKGYALDLVSGLMNELEIENYCLSAGESTISFQNNTEVLSHWTYPISSKTEQREMELSNVVVSASGTSFQGQHIFDPRTGKNDFDPHYQRVWVAADSAALSDALSTAFFLLPLEKSSEIVQANEEIEWFAYTSGKSINFIQ